MCIRDSNTVCYGKLNVKIAATHAGITVGEDGGTHQSIADLAIMRVLPGMTVLCPADAVSTAWAVRTAAEIDGPVYIRLGRLAAPVLYEEGQEFSLGKGRLLRAGTDIALFATGMMVAEALEAAERPVSYTHLDVYKRQLLGSEQGTHRIQETYTARVTGLGLTVDWPSGVGLVVTCILYTSRCVYETETSHIPI